MAISKVNPLVVVVIGISLLFIFLGLLIWNILTNTDTTWKIITSIIIAFILWVVGSQIRAFIKGRPHSFDDMR